MDLRQVQSRTRNIMTAVLWSIYRVIYYISFMFVYGLETEFIPICDNLLTFLYIYFCFVVLTLVISPTC